MRGTSVRAALFILASLFVTPVSAQIARGTVVDSGTGEPLSGSFVLLLDEEGSRAGAALADPQGRFIIRAPVPGSYTLRIELIGFATTSTPSFDLASGQTSDHHIPVAMEPIRLEGITATGEGRCRTPREVGAATSVLWEEARKALSISDWVRSDPGVPYQTMSWERSRNPISLVIEEQEVSWKSGVGRDAFISEPAAELASRGYVRSLEGGVYQYFGVDASTLLSDDFLETHCFTVRDPPSDRQNLVGLGFEPIPSHTRPDIEGALWLDRTTADLQHLEFQFTRHLIPIAVPNEPFGGRVDFHRLSNGVWIVDAWWLRMPRLPQKLMVRAGAPTQSRPTDTRRDLLRNAVRDGLRIWEEGGKLLFILPPGERTGGNAIVEGVVYDSIRGRPLSGATVFLTESRQVTRSNSEGRFALRGVPGGENGIAFLHPNADLIGLAVAPIPVSVPSQGRLRVNLGIPRSDGCRAVEDGQLPSVAGAVFDAESGEPIAGALVTAVWRSGTSTTRSSSPFSRQASGETGADGRFFLCGFPVGSEVVLSAEYTGRKAEVEFRVDTAGPVFRQLLLGK